MVDTLKQCRADGVCNEEIARRLGVCEGTIRNKLAALRDAGVKLPKYRSGAQPKAGPRRYADGSKPRLETRRGAVIRAGRLQRYWHQLGYTLAQFWIDDSERGADGSVIYTIRSNLVGGWPPGAGG